MLNFDKRNLTKMLEPKLSNATGNTVVELETRSDILDDISNSVLLNGVSFRGNLMKMKCKEKVLMINKEVHFQRSWKIPLQHEMVWDNFSLKMHEKMRFLGFSTVMCFEIGERRKKYKKCLQSECVSGNYQKTTFSFLPVHSWEARIQDFCLQKSAVKKLKEIELNMNVDADATKRLCGEFYDKFGTHALIGSVHVGKVFTNTFPLLPVELKSSKKALQMNQCFCPRNPYSCSKLNNDEAVYSLKPLEVVDREISKMENFVPIWRFILEEDTFKDRNRLAECMRKHCDTFLKEIDFDSLEETSLNFSIDTLYSIMCCGENEELFPLIIRQLSCEISNLNNFSVIQNIFHKDANATKLLQNILVKAKSSTKQIFLQVHRMFKKIHYASSKVEHFISPDTLTWIQQIDKEDLQLCPKVKVISVNQLLKAIESKDILNAAKSMPGFESYTDQGITIVLSKTITKLIERFKKNESDFEYLFLLACVIPFQYERMESAFTKLMSRSQLRIFCEKTKSKLSEFESLKRKSVQVQHAWVTRWLITEILNSHSSDPSTLSSALPDEFLGGKIRVHDNIKAIIKNNGDLRSMVSELSRILDDERNETLVWKNIRKVDGTVKKVQTPESTYFDKEALEAPLKTILRQMKIKKYFPEKITIRKALKISDKTFSSPSNERDIPWEMLRKIISCNFNFREKTILVSQSKTILVKKDIMASDSESDTEHDGQKVEQKCIHPQDAFYAIFLCCDPFLKAFICRKLSEMQMAIPISYPYLKKAFVLSMWPMRHLYFGDNRYPIAKTPSKVVSFLRVGAVNFKSKSKLINEFLRDQNEEHSTFYHRECLYGSQPRNFYNGAIEASWYIPPVPLGKSAEKSNSDPACLEQLLILNLRGDAFEYRNQVNQLVHMSHVIVVLMEYANMANDDCLAFMSELHKKDLNVVIITNNPKSKSKSNLRREMKEYKQKANVDNKKTKTILTVDCETGTEKNTVSMRAEISQILMDILTTMEQKNLEDKLSVISKFPWTTIDENNENCRFGKDIALRLFDEMNKNYPKNLIKIYILPLQGRDLWQKLSECERKLKTSGQTQDSEEKLIETMTNIRKKQADLCNSEDFKVMCMFANTLSLHIENKKKVMFFLTWFEKLLDQQSRSVLPEEIEKLSKAYSLPKDCPKYDVVIKEAEESLFNASLGIENFFREFGQIYECYCSCLNDGYHIEEKTWRDINNFPIVAAKLLLYGRSLEIMDGDAMNVPLTWIRAVFSELENLLKQKRIFSVSVLGVQSSGKSTLLNTMFGLEFPVSSGRCTKGIFLQLLPVKRNDLNYDYIMIFDTEGLSSPDQINKQTKHDNKLATLAIGIADTVIINIKGETIGEMENILQIVVHALIRLKQANPKVELRQSCIFVHQNVNTMDKSYNLRPDIQRTQRNLDRITEEIADQEHMDCIKKFSDVISFESDTDVMYVTNLWHGNPPMAPKSPAYSEDVENIFKQVLHGCSKKVSSHLSVWDTFLRIESIWDGILAEDFVFSFRNCLEVKAYTMLQSKFQQLSWELEKKMHLFWCNNVRPQLFKCSEHDIDDKQAELQHIFHNEIYRCLTSTQDDLNAFIEKSDLNTQMIQWKENKNILLKETVSKMESDFDRKLRYQVAIFKIKLRNNDKETEEKIMQNIADYAKSFKGKSMTDSEMNEKFQDKWIMLLTALAPSTQVDSHHSKMRNLQNKIKDALRLHFQAHSALLEKEFNSFDGLFNESREHRLTIDFADINSRYLSLKSGFRNLQHKFHLSNETMEKCTCKALQLTREFYQQIINYFSDQEHEGVEYGETHFHHILKLLVANFEKHNASDPDFSFGHEYQIKIALCVTKYAYSKFSELNRKFEEKHNLHSLLQSKKEKAKQVFEDIIKEKENAVIATNYLCKEIEDQLKKKTSSFIATALKEDMLKQFSFLKSELIVDILTNLAEKDIFEDYLKYIDEPEDYARVWVKLKTEAYFFSRESNKMTCYASYAKRQLGQNISFITDTALNITENKNVRNLTEWVTLFCVDLHIFELDVGRSKIFEKYQVKDLKAFCDIFIQRLNEIENGLLDMYINHVPTDITWEGKDPVDDIFDTLWGCQEHCLWCQEPCEMAVRGHVQKDGSPHKCRQHRPFASTGIFKTSSKELITECCNFKVHSDGSMQCGRWCGCNIPFCFDHHPYKQYKKYMPHWDIPPSSNISGSRFWCWFTGRYIHDLSIHYNKNEPNVPTNWKYISKESAIKSLRTNSDPPKSVFEFIKEKLFYS